MELGVDIGAMVEEGSFVIFPPQSEALAFGFSPGLLIDCGEVISIGRWFFLGISEDDIRDGPARPASKGAALAGDGVWDLRLDDIRIVRRAIFESAVLREAELMRGVAPGGGRLVPPRVFLLHWDMGITEQD